ncbi:MAG: hypothetical protein ACRDOZ_00860 [Nocardioides sp.]
MKPSLWLHCGAYKSGSSRIQNQAWSRREELLDHGWLYPRAGLVTHDPDVGNRHARLAYAFFQDREEWDRLVDDLVAEIRDSAAEHVLLSEEAWSLPKRGGEALAALLDHLRGANCVGEEHGVLYLRNRFSYARSLYREFTRRRKNQLTLGELVDANPRRFDSLETVRTLQALIDPEQLHVYSYEASGDTAAHLFGRLGLPFAEEESWTNLGLGAAEIEAYRQVNLINPELAPRFPGLRDILPSGLRIDDEEHAEQFDAGQLESSDEWRTEFRQATGWTDEQVELLVTRPEAAPHDIAALGPAIRGVVETWVQRVCVPHIEATTHPHPHVDDFQLSPIDAPATSFRLVGWLLPHQEAPPMQVITIDDDGERRARQGLKSPEFGRQFPGRPEAADARFVVPECKFGQSGRIDILVEHPSGERSLLASVRQRWDPR